MFLNNRYVLDLPRNAELQINRNQINGCVTINQLSIHSMCMFTMIILLENSTHFLIRGGGGVVGIIRQTRTFHIIQIVLCASQQFQMTTTKYRVFISCCNKQMTTLDDDDRWSKTW